MNRDDELQRPPDTNAVAEAERETDQRLDVSLALWSIAHDCSRAGRSIADGESELTLEEEVEAVRKKCDADWETIDRLMARRNGESSKRRNP